MAPGWVADNESINEAGQQGKQPHQEDPALINTWGSSSLGAAPSSASCSCFPSQLILWDFTVFIQGMHVWKTWKWNNKWKQALQCFISIKLSQKQIQAVIDVPPLQSPTPSSIQLWQKNTFPGELDQLYLTADTRGTPKIPLHFSLWCWLHTPWKLHPKAVGLPGKFSTYFKRLRPCRK